MSQDKKPAGKNENSANENNMDAFEKQFESNQDIKKINQALGENSKTHLIDLNDVDLTTLVEHYCATTVLVTLPGNDDENNDHVMAWDQIPPFMKYQIREEVLPSVVQVLKSLRIVTPQQNSVLDSQDTDNTDSDGN